MLEPKVLAIGASIGFVLSFLIGIISGATFLTVLIRALCMAALFGGLASVGRFMLIRFVPELLEEASSEPQAAEKTGSVVDISVGDPLNATGPGVDSLANGSSDLVPDFLESANERMPAPASPLSRAGVPPGENSGAVEDVRSARPSQPSAHRDPVTVDGLDVLPDLQDFMPRGHQEQDGESEAIESSIQATDSVFVAPDVTGTDAESATMAKAIRTILSRDN